MHHGIRIGPTCSHDCVSAEIQLTVPVLGGEACRERPLETDVDNATTFTLAALPRDGEIARIAASGRPDM